MSELEKKMKLWEDIFTCNDMTCWKGGYCWNLGLCKDISNKNV